MSDNPIRKILSGGWSYSEDRARPGWCWGAVCPECAVVINGRSRTRKQAKSLLHYHLKSSHAGPGGCAI